MQKIEAAQFESLFEQRLEVYESDREMLVQEQEDQDQIAARLREANATFTEARKGDTSTREREKALQVGRGFGWVGITSMRDGQRFTSNSSLVPLP